MVGLNFFDMLLKFNIKIWLGVISIKNILEIFSDGMYILKGEFNFLDYVLIGDVLMCVCFLFILSVNSNLWEFDFIDLVLVCLKLIYLKI